jgi:hypothetical protein
VKNKIMFCVFQKRGYYDSFWGSQSAEPERNKEWNMTTMIINEKKKKKLEPKRMSQVG